MILSPTPAATRRNAGFNLIELLVVIVIIATLTSIAIPGYSKILDTTRAANDITNLRGLVNAAFKFASDNNEKLPSPQYQPGASGLPDSWDAAETGSGLWLDGTIFDQVYPDVDIVNDPKASAGDHLVGTIFVSDASVKKNTDETDFYRHSYAMNANLQYDRIHDTAGTAADKYLTEKTYANLNAMNSGMLFIDCVDTNIVKAEDYSAIKEAGEERRQGYVITAFLDGHVEKLRFTSPDGAGMVPSGDPESDLDSAKFWRGVNDEKLR